ncbi:MAG: tetratricopeptide repeat protein [Candidatus Binatia bacterium]
MAFVNSIVNMVAEVGPVWLLMSPLLGSALAVLVPTVRTRIVRRKHWERSMVAAQTASQEGRYNEAEMMFNALLEKAEEDFGPEDPKVASAIRNLAMLYQAQGRYTDAELLLHKALAIMDNVDPDNLETSAVLEQLAEVWQAQGRYAATEIILQRSLAIRERALGPDHPHVANVLNQMAMLYQKVGKKDEAKRLVERRPAMASRGEEVLEVTHSK